MLGCQIPLKLEQTSKCTVRFFTIYFSDLFEESLLQRYQFKISVETVKPFGSTVNQF